MSLGRLVRGCDVELDEGAVLVVDDQAEVREALAEGYEVRAEADGDAALRAAAAWHPGVVIVDVTMPGGRRAGRLPCGAGPRRSDPGAGAHPAGRRQ
ncbi:hypothetical protein [Actinomadura rubrisoli]|uniref:hypothetical protein n=1 Tax=Actinomadura rubrisoli TaxID=2530368 RepID=UPI001FB7E9CA|nr:hypothetical protein [Actinomadura rubrisoli]